MKKLEDQLKDAFDHFEPEVDPSVWTRISSQLPVSPSGTEGLAGKTASVIKGSVVKTISWIAAAAAVVTTAAVLLVNNNESEKPADISQPVITEQAIPVEEPVITEETPTTLPQSSITYNNTLNARAQQPASSAENQKASKEPSKALTGNSVTADHSPSEEAAAGHIANKISNHSVQPSVPVSSPAPARDNSVPVINKQEETINEIPPAVLILNTRGGFAPLQVTALMNRENEKADYDFGDGTVESGVTSASHRYTEPGTYTIRCTVNGKVLEATVEVLGMIGNSFSPNGDGMNDIFRVEGEQVSNSELKIFNRYGKLIYTNKGNQAAWDGRDITGKPAEAGTYFYDIFATSVNGTMYRQKGTINLFR